MSRDTRDGINRPNEMQAQEPSVDAKMQAQESDNMHVQGPGTAVQDQEPSAKVQGNGQKEGKKDKAEARDMTIGSEAKKIFWFSVPLLIGNVFQQLYSTIDGIVVGQVVGDDALAGVGASFPIIFLLVSMLMGIGIGATVLISQFLGAKDYETVTKISDTILIATVVLALCLTGIGLLIADPFLHLIQTPAEAMPYASTFLKYTFAGLIGMAGYNITSAILRGLGDSKTPLYFLIVATVINFILLMIFVVGMHMGVTGAALATAIAQFASFLFALVWLNKTHPLIRVDWRHMKFDRKLFLAVIRIGLPSGLQQMLVSVSMIIIQAVINPFGTAVIAGVTAATRIQQFTFMPLFSINMAVSAFTGQNVGAGKMDRVSRGLRASLLISGCISLVMALICVVWGDRLVGLFNPNPEMIRVGHEFLTIIMPFMLPACVMFVCMGVMRGAGDALSSLIISMITLWVFRIPMVMILPHYFGYVGIFWGACVDWGVGAIITFAWYKTGRWKKKIAIHQIRGQSDTK